MASKARPTLTFSLVTTPTNPWMARIHNRMPVILQNGQIDTWLDPALPDPHQLGELLKAPPEGFLDCYPVSRKVNSVKFDESEYAEKIDLDYLGLLQDKS